MSDEPIMSHEHTMGPMPGKKSLDTSIHTFIKRWLIVFGVYLIEYLDYGLIRSLAPFTPIGLEAE